MRVRIENVHARSGSSGESGLSFFPSGVGAIFVQWLFVSVVRYAIEFFPSQESFFIIHGHLLSGHAVYYINTHQQCVFVSF